MTSDCLCANIRSISEKFCGRCGRTKPIDAFGFKDRQRGVRQSYCKSCETEYKKIWYQRNRESHKRRVFDARKAAAAYNRAMLWAYLSEHSCVDCGETDPVVLEFAHLRDKRGNISAMVREGLPWPTIEAEIAKCVIRCANCHRRETLSERGLAERKRLTTAADTFARAV